MQGAAVDILNLVKRYRRLTVLDGVSLAVEAGESFGLVGVNGAGKTTLIKCLLDLCTIDAGDIRIFDRRHTLTEARQPLTFLPERFQPPYYLTGEEFLRYANRLAGVAFSDAGAAAADALDLDPAVLAEPVREYSKGMAQKLGLIACLLGAKDLLVLDEPMSGLDPLARARFKAYLQQRKAQGQTLFFSTHMLEDVEVLCDRLAILHQGQIRFIGSPGDLRQAYAQPNLEQAYISCIQEQQGAAPAAMSGQV